MSVSDSPTAYIKLTEVEMRNLIWSLVVALVLIGSPIGATPLSVHTPTQQTQGNPDVKVWVNTHSGIYHCPGTRWYGRTKQGEYMTQKQAQEKGYRPAYGKVCQ